MANQAQGEQIPITTIVPFNDIQKLPACAAECGALYDANGACVPPAVQNTEPTVWTQCFCQNSAVAGFSTGTKGVCDQACTADSGGLSSIAGWFSNICSVTKDAGGNKANGDQTTTTTTAAGATGVSKASSSGGGGGDWLSGHWQWVIFLVVMVVGITGIWIGACIWRRRYLRNKDRQSTLDQKHSGSAKRPSWGPGVAASASGSGSGSVAPAGYDSSPYEPNRASQGMFMPNSGAGAVPYDEEKAGKKKWRLFQRT